jgi:CubicO group peptidase (beta-lactamase class C family)
MKIRHRRPRGAALALAGFALAAFTGCATVRREGFSFPAQVPTASAADILAATTIGRLPDEAALDALIAAKRNEAGLVGLGAAVLVDGKLVWAKGYGTADRATWRPFTPDTVMNIGSISKTVTGVALMQAVEDGKLALDEDVSVYLPFRVRNPRFPDDKITLRQLATHTSGIVDREAVYDTAYHQGGDSPVALGDFLRDYFSAEGRHWSADNYLDAKPGSNREYSNIGAALAGYAVERVTGKTLPELAKLRIFGPLGMTNSTWSLAETDLTRHTKLYEVAASGSRRTAREIQLYGLATYPDGGVRTSVADLSRFFLALLNGGEFAGARILRPETTAEMLRFQYTAEHKPDNVELNEKNSGIFWSTKMDVTLIGHGGSDPGIKTEMLARLDGKVGVILFTNTNVDDRAAGAFVGILRELFARGDALRARADTSH